MTDVLDIAAAQLRRVGFHVVSWSETMFRVGEFSRRFGRTVTVSRNGGNVKLVFRYACIVAEYSVTEWTPRHTSAVQAWIEEAIVDEELGGEVEG